MMVTDEPNWLFLPSLALRILTFDRFVNVFILLKGHSFRIYGLDQVDIDKNFTRSWFSITMGQGSNTLNSAQEV